MESDDEFNIAAFLGALWRGKWILLVCALLTGAVGAYNAYVVAVPKYRATTTLVFQNTDNQLVDIESVVSGVRTDFEGINTEIEVIRSRGLLESLVRELDLHEDPEFNPALRPPPQYSLDTLIGPVIDAARTAASELGLPIAPPTVPDNNVSEPAMSDEAAAINRAVNQVRASINVNLQRNTYLFTIRATTENPQKSALIANTLAELYIADQIDVKS
ncbi:Wzz/FepE/Etk N-terminal domain-containing protein [Citreimonas sp.]|uniref:Wzz/FepE/Etk N-terminal domain-containing protein n=1 Tax=Citreimonas sp. TaxID=3036715 RepID=UPI0035C7C3EB